ncbi:MAG: hypothetical protein IJK42_00425 [Prevotella sp.]|nr:hypothetical protein [Prevotella sp.]MBQ6208226.1 hypothetical protein [Prevotella sp.]
MFSFNDAKEENFKRIKGICQDVDLHVKKRVTFYRTKPGCYTPPPYQLKYRKLSEIMK